MQRCNPWAIMVGAIFALLGGVAQSQSLAPETSAASSVAVRKVLREFNAWAAVQRLYDADQVRTFREKIIEKSGQLSGDELEDFLDDLSDRLSVLTSAEAREARRWLSQTLAVASDSYAKEVRSKLPDVAKLSASELAEQLDEFQGRQTANQQYRAGLDKTRQAHINSIRDDRRRQENANSQAGRSNGVSSPFSPAAPRTYNRRPPPPIFGGFGW